MYVIGGQRLYQKAWALRLNKNRKSKNSCIKKCFLKYFSILFSDPYWGRTRAVDDESTIENLENAILVFQRWS